MHGEDRDAALKAACQSMWDFSDLIQRVSPQSMIRYRQSSSCGTSWRLGVHIGACVLTAPRGWFARGGHAPQEFGCLVTWWAPGPQIEASPVVMGASAWRSCLEFLSLGRFLSCYCVKSRCPA